MFVRLLVRGSWGGDGRMLLWFGSRVESSRVELTCRRTLAFEQ